MALDVLVLGNELFEPDALAIKVSRKLAKKMGARVVRFKKVSDPSELFKKRWRAKRVVVLDVVKGIKKVTLLDLNRLRCLGIGKRVSTHDFDYAFLTRIMQAMGQKPRVLLIGIPFGYDEEKAAREVEKVINGKLPKVLAQESKRIGSDFC